MPSTDPLPQVQIVRMRVTKLDADGVPSPGAGNMYVTDKMIKVGWSPVYKDGNEIEVTNGAGTLCTNYRSPDSLKRADVSIELCVPDPELVAMLTSGATISATPTARPYGWAMPAIGEITGNGVSIEWWTRRIDNGVQDATYPWAWWVMPRVKNLRHADKTHEDGAQPTVITGQGYENANWYNGPANNWGAASSKVVQWLPSRDSELPAAVVGAQTLSAS